MDESVFPLCTRSSYHSNNCLRSNTLNRIEFMFASVCPVDNPRSGRVIFAYPTPLVPPVEDPAEAPAPPSPPVLAPAVSDAAITATMVPKSPSLPTVVRGLLHWSSGFWYILTTAIIVGIPFAILRLRCGNILVPFGAHLALNTAETLFLWLA